MAQGLYLNGKQLCLFALAKVEVIINELDHSFGEDEYNVLFLAGQTLIRNGSTQEKTHYIVCLRDAAIQQQLTSIRNLLGHLLAQFLESCEPILKEQHYNEIASLFSSGIARRDHDIMVAI